MSSSQDFTCVFCSEMFEDKESLQEHFRKHGDPKFNNITKKNRHQNEASVGSEKSEEGEMVGCDVCDEMFPSISKAITHKHKVHPDHDAKHFCPWCGKFFTMKHLYNKHMKSNHTDMSRNDENIIYHCDTCAVDFYAPSAMVYHNKFYHRQDELPSIGHSKKVKIFNQEFMFIQIYYCPFCGEEYNNKINLHKHMADDHSDENQSPEEVLRCPLCDAVFYHLDAYELHLSFHSMDDSYSDESEIPSDITEFSLESVPPIMEKVEEETKISENEGIDKFLQLIMDESRESGNNDTNDKPKSKKHKKHKKSKKAAITLDEFLNMNKDVFGDGLDVQGIEEIPTQQVLKKCKGKRDNMAKPIPASAIAKLKKQGITVKSNSGKNSPILKANANLMVKSSSNLPVKVQDKFKADPSELLSKLINQGNSQIKIVKKSTIENSFKNSDTSQECSSSKSNQSVHDKLSSESNVGVTNINDKEDMTQESNEESNNVNPMKLSESMNKTDMISPNISEDSVSTTVNRCNINTKQLNENKDTEITIKPNKSINKIDSPDFSNRHDDHEENMADQDDSFKSKQDLEYNDKNEDDNPEGDNRIISESKENSNKTQKPNNNSLNALKHLSGFITIKPAQSAEDKSNTKELFNKYNEDEDMTENGNPSNEAQSNNIQAVTVKKPQLLQDKLTSPTKTKDTFKNLSKQLTITPCITSTTHSGESEDDESDQYESNSHNKNIVNEDTVNFKTPLSLTKQLNSPSKSDHPQDTKKPTIMKNTKKEVKQEEDTKNSLNMDILKRLTNVTAKPVVKGTTTIQATKTSVQSTNSPKSVIQDAAKVEKNKQIDQEIEIFNIDDSDSDQEPPDVEPSPKDLEKDLPSNESKTASTDMLKNLSKNITIKSTNPPNKNISHKTHVNKQVHVETLNTNSDKNIRSPINNENKNSQDKRINFNNHLNDTLKKLGNNISIKSQFSTPDPNFDETQDEDLENHMSDDSRGSDSETTSRVKITEMQDDEELPSDSDMEYNNNATVQSPQPTISNNDEYINNSHSEEETNEDIESQIKVNTLPKEISTSTCLDNFKRNNSQLTIKSLNEKKEVRIHPQACSPGSNKKEEVMKKDQVNKFSKEMSVKQFRDVNEDHEAVMNTLNQSAATSSSCQKVTNQVNTVKTVKTFQSETIIEEITTTVTKTVRTVNQSSKQVAQNANSPTNYRPRLVLANHQAKPVHGMTVRNAQTVGSKVRNVAPTPRLTISGPAKPTGQLVPIRPQNLIVPRQPGMFRPNAPGPSNVRKKPQTVQKPTIGKPLKISPLAINQTLKRAPEETAGHFSCFKRPKDSMISSMDAFDDDFDDDSVNYSSASSTRSDFSTTATKIVKGKSVVTATQGRSEQHSEQHISKLNNMAGLKIVRTAAKQASQVETRQDMGTAKRTTLDAIERLQKQGLLVKKPRIEESEENEQYNSDSGADDYYDE